MAAFLWQAVEKFFHRQWNRIQRDPFGPLFPSHMTGPVRCRWCVCQKPLRRAARHPFKIALTVAGSVIRAFIGLLLMAWSSQCQFGETLHCLKWWLRNDGRQRVSDGSPSQPVRHFTKLSYIYINIFIYLFNFWTNRLWSVYYAAPVKLSDVSAHRLTEETLQNSYLNPAWQR